MPGLLHYPICPASQMPRECALGRYGNAFMPTGPACHVSILIAGIHMYPDI